jgi:ribonuclease HI
MSGRSANELHLVGAVQALQRLKKELPVTLYTTSGYLRDGLTRWLEGWQRRNWLTNDGRPVSNRTHWQQLAGLRNRYAIEVILARRDNGYCLLQEAKELAREYSRSVDPRRSGQFSS